MLQLLDEAIRAEAYNDASDVFGLDLQFNADPSMQETFALYQTIPNPAHGQVRIPFFLPEAGNVRLQLYGSTGILLHTAEGQFAQGTNFFELNVDPFASSGSLFYQVISDQGEATRQMIQIE